MMEQNYWIEVYYTNGKTLRKESNTINETYAILNRYVNGRVKPSVQYVRAGYSDRMTHQWNKIESVAT